MTISRWLVRLSFCLWTSLGAANWVSQAGGNGGKLGIWDTEGVRKDKSGERCCLYTLGMWSTASWVFNRYVSIGIGREEGKRRLGPEETGVERTKGRHQFLHMTLRSQPFINRQSGGRPKVQEGGIYPTSTRISERTQGTHHCSPIQPFHAIFFPSVPSPRLFESGPTRCSYAQQQS